MHNLLTAVTIGLIAGLLDIIPMLIQMLEKRAIISAFVHYLVLGLIIPFVNWDLLPWIKGAFIALLSAIPIMIVVYPHDKKAIIQCVFSRSYLEPLLALLEQSLLDNTCPKWVLVCSQCQSSD